MRRLLRQFVLSLGRFILSLRYRIEIKGAEKLEGIKGPMLIMPSHPGYCDPPIILTTIGRMTGGRPLAFADNMKIPVIGWAMRLVDTLEVPNLTQASENARAQAEELINRVVGEMAKGDSFIVWPAGRLERTGREILGAARSCADIARAVPNATLVVVRTRGVWGSSLSYAKTGKSPSMVSDGGRGILWALASLVFFMPRRHVTLNIEVLDRAKLPGYEREKFNGYLEDWYNADLPKDGHETPTFVPYHFLFGPRSYEYPETGDISDLPVDKVSDKTKQEVATMIAEKIKRPLEAAEQKPETTLEAMGLDSLDRMEVSLQIENRFGFRAEQVPNSLGEVWVLAQGLAAGAEQKGPPTAPPAWNDAPMPEGTPLEVLGETLLEALVNRVFAHPGDVAVADDLSGVLTYEKLLLAATLIGRRVEKLEGNALGIMLPASVAADILFLAVTLQGRLPVMLNWTTGPANLAHAAKITGMKHVLTSRKFVDRLGVHIEGVNEVYLEDVKDSIGKVEGVLALIKLKLFGRGALGALPTPKASDPAVVLFTSGSEKAPKAVPLTNANLVNVVRTGGQALGLTRRDIMLGFLPPFHSFGLSGNMLISMMTGMRIVHHPDPTEASGLVRKIIAFKPTLLFTTPTFVNYILNLSKPGDLDSLRILVTGAEKCPDSTFDRCDKLAPKAIITEGYGITECSPVISVNRPGHVKRGTIGPPLDKTLVKVVDADSFVEKPRGEMGMLLVGGPNVFPGYLSYDGPSPFREENGERWYVTGDLAKVDDENFITFCGRLKRFIKAGGEMISLPALEEPLAAKFPPTEEGPQVAVEGIETADGRCVVLFTKQEIDLRAANAILTASGLRGVMRLDEVRKVEKIPVLGTGKTDYKVLRAQIQG